MENTHKIICIFLLSLIFFLADNKTPDTSINKFEHSITVNKKAVETDPFLRLKKIGNISVIVVQIFIQFKKEYLFPVLENTYSVLIKIPLENLKQFPRKGIVRTFVLKIY